MAKRIDDTERIEIFFRTQPLDQCMIQKDKIDLIMRIRGGTPAPVKRGRKPKKATDEQVEDLLYVGNR